MTRIRCARAPLDSACSRLARVAARVLLVEDDARQAEIIRLYLVGEGHEVLLAGDGRDGIDLARTHRPDLVVLDLMLPRVDGLDVCRTLRRESDVPILMLTARSSEDDMLLGFDLGVDDYLTKPFSPRELMARVRSLLRRGAGPVPESEVHEYQGLRVDVVQHRITLHGRAVDCTPAEFRLLQALIEEPGRAFSRRELLEQMHGFDRFITERTVDAHIKNLRRKLEAESGGPQYIMTVFGVGYRLEAPAGGHAS